LWEESAETDCKEQHLRDIIVVAGVAAISILDAFPKACCISIE
jgi:hypothetical protein